MMKFLLKFQTTNVNYPHHTSLNELTICIVTSLRCFYEYKKLSVVDCIGAELSVVYKIPYSCARAWPSGLFSL